MSVYAGEVPVIPLKQPVTGMFRVTCYVERKFVSLSECTQL